MDNQPNNQSQQVSQVPPSQPQPQATIARPKKKIPTWAKILGVVSVVAIVLGIVLVLVLKYNDSEVNSFLDAIYRGDFTSAYNYFSPELKEVQSLEDFEAGAKTLNMDDSCETNWTTNITGVSTSTGSYKEIGGTIKCNSGNYKALFKLIKQNDDYKLYSYSIKP